MPEIDRYQQLSQLRARRRSRARGESPPDSMERLANPLLPPWMMPSSFGSSFPLGAGMPSFNSLDAKRGPVVGAREYPPELGNMGTP